MTEYKNFYEKNEGLIWLSIILGPLLVLGIAYILAPDQVWNDFIWRYYVAPIEADARDAPVDGITSSYNIVDTTTYGIVLILTVFGIFRFLKWLKVKPGRGMFFATIPYILLGGVLRSLEDAGLFTGKVVYLFIAPIIYIFIGLVTVLKIYEAHTIEKIDKAGGHEARVKALWMFVAIHVFFNILYVIGYSFYVDGRELFSVDQQNMAYLINPALSVLLSICAFLGLLILIKRRGRIGANDVHLVFGLHFLALAGFHALAFIMGNGRWPGPVTGPRADMNLVELAMVPLLAMIVTAIFVGLMHGLSKRVSWLKIYWKRPVNIAIMFGHMFDAAATFTALQFYPYSEKHVVPNFLIQLTGTPAVMFILKLFVIAFVLYSIDIVLKPDLKRNKLMRTLVRIAVLVLGLAPGTRDLMRLAMGV